jgi:hypothetical protein
MPFEFSSSLDVKKLDNHHPEYKLFSKTWRDLGLLYAGGDLLKDKAPDFLARRPKEPPDIWASRQDVFDYTNLIGNICGWYTAAAFSKPIEFMFKLANAANEEAAMKLPADAQAFIDDWQADCNGAGVDLPTFWQRVFEQVLIYKHSYVLIDLPEPGSAVYASKMEQRIAGALDPVLINYDPTCIKNWGTDDYGNLQWCVLKVTTFESKPLMPNMVRDCWYIYEPTQVWAFANEYEADITTGRQSDAKATKVEGYPRPHALTSVGRVPIRKVCVPDGLWLGNRIILKLRKHLNMENALDWQLINSCMAQLAVFGDYDENPQISEVAWHHFPKGTDARWLEPEGKASTITSERLAKIEENIYKSCYLMDQARTNKSTPSAQSGISKQMDKTPSRDALQSYMGILGPEAQRVIDDVLIVRQFGDQITADVRMPQFVDRDSTDTLEEVQILQSMNIQSDSFDKELQKQAIRVALPEGNPALIELIEKEIEAAPTKSEMAAQQAQVQQLAFEQSFAKNLQ